ncbi:MAG: hypothetical protein RL033_6065 [Pseudomonadota bacterium]
MLISVVIPNYNYAEFVAQAIESALALTGPTVEVIVVDDGSTDNSPTVIQRYADRITAIFQQNEGQRVACNVGYAASSGDVVIFLDADDMLDPTLGEALAQIWRPGLSKVQFQMKIVDRLGRPTGDVLPQFAFAPSAQQIRRWVQAAGAYPSPPGSGNAYARTFLEQIFPLLGSEPFTDSYCLAAAPYLGDILTVARPLVSYRVHGGNAGALSDLDPGRFAAEVGRALWRFRYAREVAARAGISVPERVQHRSLRALAYRLASLRLRPAQHPLPGDSLTKVLIDFGAGFLVDRSLPLRARAALLAWAVLLTLSPLPIAERLVLWRFAPARRPQLLRRVLRKLAILRANAGPT